MIRWIVRKVAAVGLCTILTGCANVKVQKVDLQDRMYGTDTRVKGFRYYLTRPYLVISSRIDVTTTYKPVWPAVRKTAVARAAANADQPQAGQAPAPMPRPALLADSVPELYFVGAELDRSGNYLVYDHAGNPSDVPFRDLIVLSAVVNKPDTGGRPLTAAEFRTAFRQAAATAVAKRAYGSSPTKGQVDASLTAFSSDKYNLVTLLNNDMDAPAAISKVSDTTQTSFDDAVAKSVKATIGTINDYLRTLNMAAMPFTQQDLETAIKNELPKPTGTPSQAKPGAGTMAKTTPPPKLTPNPTPPTDGGKTVSTTPPSQQNAAPTQDSLPYQVVFLPDFEEQYAIRNINFAAKTKYHYTFRNGTDLETVSGGFDSTDVPVAIVQTVGALLTAVSQITPSPAKTPTKGGGLAALGLDQTHLVDAPYYVRTNLAIEPGVYRVQKSWERAAAAHTEGMAGDQLCGLFGDVGLQLVESVSVIDAKTHTTLTQKPKPQPGSDSPPADPTSGQ
ncbi:MAG TPA: hypothetical protein VKU02_30565 [Gemmataceae bacterium]|nr:hypothetical protein [Gemmataceae bacterium]